MLDHVGFAVSDIARSRAFYENALAALGLELIKEYAPDRTESGGTALGFGKDDFPFFWIGDNERPGEGTHIAFRTENRAAVDAFWQAGVANGGTDDGPPGVRAIYHPTYYAAFLTDPSGNRVEAVCHRG